MRQNRQCLVKLWKCQTAVSILLLEAKALLQLFCLQRGSGLGRTDDFQKFCGTGLDWIQFYRIRTGLGLKNFTVRSSLLDPCKN